MTPSSIKDDLRKKHDGKRLEMWQYELLSLHENDDIIYCDNGSIDYEKRFEQP